MRPGESAYVHKAKVNFLVLNFLFKISPEFSHAEKIYKLQTSDKNLYRSYSLVLIASQFSVVAMMLVKIDVKFQEFYSFTIRNMNQ